MANITKNFTIGQNVVDTYAGKQLPQISLNTDVEKISEQLNIF
jgi:hypothetical protein